jgi:hypothetical protein
MSRRRLPALAALVLLLLLPAAAHAQRVLVLEPDGHVRAVNNRFLDVPQARQVEGILAVAARAHPTKRRPKPSPTLPSVLAKLVRRGQLSAAAEAGYVHEWYAVLHEEARLPAARRAQLAAVTVLVHGLAVSGALTPARLPVVFLTLERNAQWWQSGAFLTYGQRVEFHGSSVIWEYYPGSGLALQPLATFGEADAMYTAGPSEYGQLSALLTEMAGYAVPRAGGIAWEYYFPWEGGAPGWVSAMAQGTAIEAYTRGYLATGNASFLTEAEQALPLFASAPPAGVAVAAPAGTRYLQYSFAPREEIINAFLQSLIGLDTLARTGNATAQRLFAAGNAEALAELPSFNTGAWSLYQPGQEDDLSYHELVTGFLSTLCTLTATPLYCSTATAFAQDLHTPPAVYVIGAHARPRHAFSMRFHLSKISHVGIVVASRDGHDLVYTSGEYGYGVDRVAVPALRRGRYTVRLAATDLAGNVGRFAETLTVS